VNNLNEILSIVVGEIENALETVGPVMSSWSVSEMREDLEYILEKPEEDLKKILKEFLYEIPGQQDEFNLLSEMYAAKGDLNIITDRIITKLKNMDLFGMDLEEMIISRLLCIMMQEHYGRTCNNSVMLNKIFSVFKFQTGSELLANIIELLDYVGHEKSEKDLSTFVKLAFSKLYIIGQGVGALNFMKMFEEHNEFTFIETVEEVSSYKLRQETNKNTIH
jgi:hypothetical protein